jgi:hypothetical protein
VQHRTAAEKNKIAGSKPGGNAKKQIDIKEKFPQKKRLPKP